MAKINSQQKQTEANNPLEVKLLLACYWQSLVLLTYLYNPVLIVTFYSRHFDKNCSLAIRTVHKGVRSYSPGKLAIWGLVSKFLPQNMFLLFATNN